jgi:LysM repeat protein
MTVSPRLAGAFALALIWTSPAVAAVPHTVQPGETLWSIAAANNFTTRALAAANGLPETAQVVAGRTISIPSEGEAAAALSSGGTAPGGGGAGAPPAAGGYIVRPGDTLSGIAARSGVSPAQVAFMNGLKPDSHVISGTVMKLPVGATGTTTQATPPPAQAVVPAAAPQPTPGRVSAARSARLRRHTASGLARLGDRLAGERVQQQRRVVRQRARRHADPARHLELGGGQHRPTPDRPELASGERARGRDVLNRLIRDAGGDVARGVAGYYQGPASVSRIGMLPETQRYVANVMALRSRFGG